MLGREKGEGEGARGREGGQVTWKVIVDTKRTGYSDISTCPPLN